MERNLTKNMRSGENIKHMRLRFGLTQKELGEKINVSERRIGTWERGAVLPSDEILGYHFLGDVAQHAHNAAIIDPVLMRPQAHGNKPQGCPCSAAACFCGVLLWC
jgi:DNA-binding XRE family transcriptional regulator